MPLQVVNLLAFVLCQLVTDYWRKAEDYYWMILERG